MNAQALDSGLPPEHGLARGPLALLVTAVVSLGLGVGAITLFAPFAKMPAELADVIDGNEGYNPDKDLVKRAQAALTEIEQLNILANYALLGALLVGGLSLMESTARNGAAGVLTKTVLGVCLGAACGAAAGFMAESILLMWGDESRWLSQIFGKVGSAEQVRSLEHLILTHAVSCGLLGLGAGLGVGIAAGKFGVALKCLVGGLIGGALAGAVFVFGVSYVLPTVRTDIPSLTGLSKLLSWSGSLALIGVGCLALASQESKEKDA